MDSRNFLDLGVDPVRRVVTRTGYPRPVRITADKPWLLFYALYVAGAQGRTKESLLRSIWEGRPVEPNNLDQVQKSLKRILKPLGLTVRTKKGVLRLCPLSASSNS